MSSHSHHSDTNLYSVNTRARATRSTTHAESGYSRSRRDIAQGKRVLEEESMQRDVGDSDDSESSEGGESDNSEEAHIVSILKQMKFFGTRYPHRPTMQALGIWREVGKLYQAADIIGLTQRPFDGFQEETCYFLATVKLHLYEERSGMGSDEELGYVSFKIRGSEYTLPLSVVDSEFGFKRGSGQAQDFDKDELNELWLTLGGKDKYKSSRAKSSEIRHPSVRYLHRTLANTMFARRATGTVNEGELRMLDKSLQEYLVYSSQEKRDNGEEMRGDNADTGNAIVLVRHLMSYRTNAIRNDKMVNKAELAVGGIVTPFLHAAGVEITSRPTPPLWMDLDHMRDTQTISANREKDKYAFNFTHPQVGRAKILLPYGGLPKIYTEEGARSISFVPPVRDLYDQRAEMQESDDEVLRSFMDSTQPPQTFYFDDSECTSLREANQKIGFLQKWNKWQDKAYNALKKKVTNLTKRLVAAENKQKKPSLAPTYLRRTSSLRGFSRRFHFASPSRRSSVDQMQRKRRPDHPIEDLEHSSPDSTTHMDQAEQEEHTTRPTGSSDPLESNQGYAQPTPLDQPWSSTPLESRPEVDPTHVNDPNTTMVPFYTEESMQARIDAYFSSRQ